jgi:uncharacterized membrane protein YkoI
MNIKRIAPFALAALLAVGAAGGIAYAESRDGGQDGRDIAALSTMKVTLPQAIAAAEQQSGGRAVSADIQHQHGTAAIAVEVAGPQGVKTVLVDAQSGLVTATQGSGDDGEDND